MLPDMPDIEETTQDKGAATSPPDAAERFASERRKLCVMRTGARLFAVYADEVEATSENLKPTPLPFAPAPVRGIVSRRGRIFTVIDPLLLLPPDAPSTAAASTETPAPLIISLRGDEQLALSVERIEHDIELFDEDDHEADAASNASSATHFLRRTIRHQTDTIALLDTAHIFEAAMQGVERRRRRT
jgi:chemotaxis signal transduction protein